MNQQNPQLRRVKTPPGLPNPHKNPVYLPRNTTETSVKTARDLYNAAFPALGKVPPPQATAPQWLNGTWTSSGGTISPPQRLPTEPPRVNTPSLAPDVGGIENPILQPQDRTDVCISADLADPEYNHYLLEGKTEVEGRPMYYCVLLHPTPIRSWKADAAAVAESRETALKMVKETQIRRLNSDRGGRWAAVNNFIDKTVHKAIDEAKTVTGNTASASGSKAPI